MGSGIMMALGDRSTTKMARISIDAPRERKILHGTKWRQLRMTEEAVRPPPKNQKVDRGISISQQVMSTASKLGLYGSSAEDRIKKMVKLAAPFSYEDQLFNRRYHQYVFLIENNVVVDMGLLTAEEREYYDSRTYEDRLHDPAITGEAEVVWKDERHSHGKTFVTGSLRDKFRRN